MLYNVMMLYDVMMVYIDSCVCTTTLGLECLRMTDTVVVMVMVLD